MYKMGVCGYLKTDLVNHCFLDRKEDPDAKAIRES